MRVECERVKESVIECGFVCVRERERERKNVTDWEATFLGFKFNQDD